MSKQLVRWLILSLLIANVLIFIWPRETVEPEQDRPGYRVKRLVLLSELEEEPEVTPMPAEAEGAQDMEQDTPMLEADHAEAVEPEAAESVTFEFDEPAELSRQDDAIAAVETEPEPEPEPSRCWLAGPVESTALTESLNAEFQSQGLSMNLVLRRVATQPDHWVYLQVDGGLDEQRRLSAELRERGIDHFPITDGELSGNFSLGLFRSPDGAQILAARVREAGYPVEIFLRPRYREEAWIALDDSARTSLGWTDEPGLLLQHPEMRIEEQDCPAPGV